ncbi:protein mono-ADP-ribosyltransferase PARP16 isoform X2 [Photinus pyralis]|uniref:protein mono-ADP-ribosyltransferase PARP16 isoform X2 n=1 Tax=Photinus pyralis TaxID=7054 RepID=UPI0012675BEB|nr:protein mono-ADP-ribosyltransferase PARP16 isoform X2 [Photinus pyralis]
MNDENIEMETRNMNDKCDTNSHTEGVSSVLRDNIYGCDLMLCLFLTALQSYRVDTCLRPFPSRYIHDSHKDVDSLRNLCDKIPSLETISKYPRMCSVEILELLKWLLCQKDHLSLRKVNFNKVKVPTTIKKCYQPYYTYEVIYPSKTEEAWQKRRNDRNSFLAYHGSQLDNFYSILKVGLQHNLSGDKALLFGKGIYVTSEITISMSYAPFGLSWKNSMLGNKISIIAVCEVINNPEKVKCKEKYTQRTIHGDIPDKYFVVTDSDMIRLKYLFVYKESTVAVIESWLVRNLMLVLICLYVFILFCIGFFQGPTWRKVQRYLYNELLSDVLT